MSFRQRLVRVKPGRPFYRTCSSSPAEERAASKLPARRLSCSSALRRLSRSLISLLTRSSANICSRVMDSFRRQFLYWCWCRECYRLAVSPASLPAAGPAGRCCCRQYSAASPVKRSPSSSSATPYARRLRRDSRTYAARPAAPASPARGPDTARASTTSSG